MFLDRSFPEVATVRFNALISAMASEKAELNDLGSLDWKIKPSTSFLTCRIMNLLAVCQNIMPVQFYQFMNKQPQEDLAQYSRISLLQLDQGQQPGHQRTWPGITAEEKSVHHERKHTEQYLPLTMLCSHRHPNHSALHNLWEIRIVKQYPNPVFESIIK